MNRSLLLILLLLPVFALIAWWVGKPVATANTVDAQIQQDHQHRQLIEQARKNKDIAALDRFIQEHPQSGWRDVAVFYRDEFAYRKATRQGDAQSLKDYIARYPNSQWRTFAEQRLEQIRLEEKAQVERLKRQRKLAGRPQPTLPAAETAATSQQATPAPQKAEAMFNIPKTPQPDARDRVQRALSIYEKQREKKQIDQFQQQQRQKAEQEKKRNCLRLRDQLRQLDSNIRWYELDAKGQRVFLNDQQIAAKRQETENYLKRNCR